MSGPRTTGRRRRSFVLAAAEADSSLAKQPRRQGNSVMGHSAPASSHPLTTSISTSTATSTSSFSFSPSSHTHWAPLSWFSDWLASSLSVYLSFFDLLSLMLVSRSWLTVLLSSPSAAER